MLDEGTGIKSQECTGIQILREYIMPSIIPPTALYDCTTALLDWPVKRWQAWFCYPKHQQSAHPPQASQPVKKPAPHPVYSVSFLCCKWQKTHSERRKKMCNLMIQVSFGPFVPHLCTEYKKLKWDQNRVPFHWQMAHTCVYLFTFCLCLGAKLWQLLYKYMDRFQTCRAELLSPSPGIEKYTTTIEVLKTMLALFLDPNFCVIFNIAFLKMWPISDSFVNTDPNAQKNYWKSDAERGVQAQTRRRY